MTHKLRQKIIYL